MDGTYASLGTFRQGTDKESGGDGLSVDPQLASPPGSGGTIGDAALLGTLAEYHLDAASPLVGAGQSSGRGDKVDFFGNPVPAAGKPSIGAAEPGDGGPIPTPTPSTTPTTPARPTATPTPTPAPAPTPAPDGVAVVGLEPSVPAAVVGGQKSAHGKVVVTLRNFGQTALSGPVTVTVYGSTDGQIGDTVLTFGRAIRKLKLAAGASKDLKIKVSIPAPPADARPGPTISSWPRPPARRSPGSARSSGRPASHDPHRPPGREADAVHDGTGPGRPAARPGRQGVAPGPQRRQRAGQGDGRPGVVRIHRRPRRRRHAGPGQVVSAGDPAAGEGVDQPGGDKVLKLKVTLPATLPAGFPGSGASWWSGWPVRR